MKAMKNYRLKFHFRLGVISLLGVVGLIALCGEPADESRWLETFAIQVSVWVVSWGVAAMLYRLWGLKRVMNMLSCFERRQRITGESGR